MRRRAGDLQAAFAHLDWIEPTPFHFLHVTLKEPLPDSCFEAEFRDVNCFHEAVVVEVESPALAAALPHLTIGYVRRPGPPGPLREALAPLRETHLGHEQVDEILQVRVPAARSTLLRPWTVLRRVPLRR